MDDPVGDAVEVVEDSVVGAAEDDDSVVAAEEADDEAVKGDEQDALEAMAEDEEEDNDEVMAAVVVEDNDEEVDAAVVVEAKNKNVENIDTDKSVTTTPDKKKKKRKKPPTRPAAQLGDRINVPTKVLEAANRARAVLQDTVKSLPCQVSDTFVLRSFGRLSVDPEAAVSGDTGSSRFSTPTALYPVGFSCDRYEFSPVHGRVLKLRCSILDGRRIQQKRTAAGLLNTNNSDTIHTNGPLFRVMWGRGIDDNDDDYDDDSKHGRDAKYPFDPYWNAAPISPTTAGSKGTSMLTPTTTMSVSSSSNTAAADNTSSPVAQEPARSVGMGVRVRFSNDRYFCGTIVAVTHQDSKKRRKYARITIVYDDDGSEETLVYPDADVTLIMPGMCDCDCVCTTS
jgi:hypothetical protein